MLSAPQEELRDVKKAKESATATGLLLQNLHRSNNEKIFKKEKLQDSRSIKNENLLPRYCDCFFDHFGIN